MKYEGENVMPAIRCVQAHMKEFCNQVHTGQWKGYTGLEACPNWPECHAN